MGTTPDDIRSWLQQAPADATHMLVVCDTYDWEDFPVYVLRHEDVRKKAGEKNGPNMTKLMEVYNLSQDHESQIAQRRSFNY